MLVAALAAMVSVTRRSECLLVEAFSKALVASVESLRAWVGRARCRDSSSFSEMRTASSGRSHCYVSCQPWSLCASSRAYLGRSDAVLVAGSSVADVRQRQERARNPAGALLPPAAIRVQPDAEHERNP